MIRLALALLLLPLPAFACGAETDCEIGDRSYRIHIGPDTTAPMGALVFAHGYKGSAAGVMRNGALKTLADELGVALIALDAKHDDWALANAPNKTVTQETDEMTYVADVLDDADARFDLDRTRLVASGFSAGGMMTWTLACRRSDLFAGFVPMSGTFWAPVPERCPAPAKTLVHIHGDDDPVVPLMGRPIAQTRQGEVPRALAMYEANGGFDAAQTYTAGDMTCDARENGTGARLVFCLFPGGHSFGTARLRHGWDVIID